MERIPEPEEVMDDALEVRAYREADFTRVNKLCARRVLRALPSRSGHALDLGTGPAEIPVFFCQMAPGWRVTAVDASTNMLKAAAVNLKKHDLSHRIRLLHGDAKALKGVRRRFDAIFSNSLLHHLDDPVPFWREVRRLASPRAAIVVQDLFRPTSRASARGLVRKHAGKDSPLLKELFYRSLLAAFTPAEVRAQLRAAGLPELRVARVSDRHLLVSGALRVPAGAS
jgi:ubiquinone/menaquinone biosynthesis C-methylase UbiE